MRLQRKRSPEGVFLKFEDDIERKLVDKIYDRSYPGRVEFCARCKEGVLWCSFTKDVDRLDAKTNFRKVAKTVTKDGDLHIGENAFLLTARQARRLYHNLEERMREL